MNYFNFYYFMHTTARIWDGKSTNIIYYSQFLLVKVCGQKRTGNKHPI